VIFISFNLSPSINKILLRFDFIAPSFPNLNQPILKNKIIVACIMLLQATALFAQETNSSFRTPGTVSLGTRNTFSVFNDDEAAGKGIGGQFRIQATKRIILLQRMEQSLPGMIIILDGR